MEKMEKKKKDDMNEYLESMATKMVTNMKDMIVKELAKVK